MPKAGGTMTGTIADFRSTGIDDNSNALAMTIDVNENIGLGSVPATDWHANYSVLQLGGQSGFWTHKAVGTGKALHISHNTEYDTGFKYIASDEASLYMQGDGGKHIFSTAAAGTAGNAISFSEKVRIDTDGLKFNGDTATANALHDYEEGTWTPVIQNTTGTFIQSEACSYVKVGNVVTTRGYIYNGSVASSSANWQFGGLPFQPLHETYGVVAFYAVNIPGDSAWVNVYANPTSSYIRLNATRDAGTNDWLQWSDIGTGHVDFHLTYLTT
jgi:hypothetical protein